MKKKKYNKLIKYSYYLKIEIMYFKNLKNVKITFYQLKERLYNIFKKKQKL